MRPNAKSQSKTAPDLDTKLIRGETLVVSFDNDFDQKPLKEQEEL